MVLNSELHTNTWSESKYHKHCPKPQKIFALNNILVLILPYSLLLLQAKWWGA